MKACAVLGSCALSGQHRLDAIERRPAGAGVIERPQRFARRARFRLPALRSTPRAPRDLPSPRCSCASWRMALSRSSRSLFGVGRFLHPEAAQRAHRLGAWAGRCAGRPSRDTPSAGARPPSVSAPGNARGSPGFSGDSRLAGFVRGRPRPRRSRRLRARAWRASRASADSRVRARAPCAAAPAPASACPTRAGNRPPDSAPRCRAETSPRSRSQVFAASSISKFFSCNCASFSKPVRRVLRHDAQELRLELHRGVELAQFLGLADQLGQRLGLIRRGVGGIGQHLEGRRGLARRLEDAARARSR